MISVLQSIVLLFFLNSISNIEKTKIYLLPGQGSDERIFEKLNFPSHYETVNIVYDTPHKGENLASYAKRIAEQIEEDDGFILLGVSMGGMIASEIAELKSPEQIIIISSAKNANELPGRYTFQKSVPIYKLVGPKLSKTGAQLLQPIVEPDRNQAKDTFKSMLADKDPIYLKRTIAMIINWDLTTINESIVHIHGDNDHTLPLKNINADIIVEDGSHMMTLTRANEMSAILVDVLK